ncbi:MAG: hypothetical protein JNL74_06050 [Fibrobacteres bacterium]|nr:hypothetical protein [Fibrobacterota bacterium]
MNNVSDIMATSPQTVEEALALIKTYLCSAGFVEGIDFVRGSEEKEMENCYILQSPMSGDPIYIFCLHLEFSKLMEVLIQAFPVKLPTANMEAFYRELLDINCKLSWASIGIEDDSIVVSTVRAFEHLYKEELYWALDRTDRMRVYIQQKVSKKFNVPLTK